MIILGWIIFALIAGFVGSKIVDNRGQGPLLNMTLGAWASRTQSRRSFRCRSQR